MQTMNNQAFDQYLQQLQMIFHVSCSGIVNIGADIHAVDGFLTLNEGAVLFGCACYGYGQGVLVEIGSFKGRSSIWLVHGSKMAKREKLFCIDPHTGSAEHKPGGVYNEKMPEEKTTLLEFKRNIKAFGVEDWIEPLVMSSQDAAINWNRPIRFLFIDGDHDFEAVKQDFLLWSAHVVEGGIIAFHDVPPGKPDVFPGPRMVVEKYVENNPSYKRIFHVDGTYVAMKVR